MPETVVLILSDKILFCIKSLKKTSQYDQQEKIPYVCSVILFIPDL